MDVLSEIVGLMDEKFEGPLPKGFPFTNPMFFSMQPLEQFLRAGVAKACKETFLQGGLAALHNMVRIFF